MECGMMLNRKRSVESRRESLTAFFFAHAEVKTVKEWLSIDTSDLNKTLKEMGTALRPEQMNIALRHTIQDVGRRVKTLSKKEIRKEYRAKSGRIDKAIRRPVYSLNGTKVAEVELVCGTSAAKETQSQNKNPLKTASHKRK